MYLRLPSQRAPYFSSEAEFRTAILGAYATLTDYYSSSNSGGGFGNAELQAWYLPGDDLTIGNGNSFEIFKGLSASDGSLNQVWKSSYIMIGRSNKVLQRVVGASSAIFTTPGLQNAIEGEALFLRAFGHFQLWNLFGTAPIDTIVPASTDEFNPSLLNGYSIAGSIDLGPHQGSFPVAYVLESQRCRKGYR
jgi:hypothetical protein